MIQENVYVRLPEAAVSMTALLTETSKKVKISMCELIMLNSQFVPVTEEGKG